ncbi:MAG: hypothetical protein ABSH49_11615 [Bryobacteraceae bacterium]|jgi:hypothetical protein
MPAKSARRRPVAAAPAVSASLSQKIQESPWRYVVASLLLLIPCQWQPRIEAGDLGSHIYNCWLAEWIARQHPAGLKLVHPSTNILFDWLLAGWYRLAGPSAAQHLAVPLAVLVFVWGAFAFISVLSQRRAWNTLPVVAMLAYGWVYHMGLFNFYLSLGLSLWALALAWSFRAKPLAGAAGLFALAYLAHALAVAWGFELLAFRWLALRVWPQHPARVLGGVLAAIVVAHFAIVALLPSVWTMDQLQMATGAGQLEVFDGKYKPLFVALAAIWALEAVNLVRFSGLRALWRRVPVQLAVISAATVFLIPGKVQFSDYRYRLVFIPERLSLGTAVAICAMLAAATPRRWLRLGQWGLAAIFFAFLFHDESALNRLEERVEKLVDRLPPGQRVIMGLDDPALQSDPIAHMIDRACLGRCFSYANYEPSTWQFRVRATGPNPYVVWTYEDSWSMQAGLYVVRPADLPMYQATMDAEGKLGMRELPAGEPCGMTYWKTLPDLLSDF